MPASATGAALLSDKAVLVIGTYPIRKPQHGGQKRALALVEAYRSVFKTVQYIAVYATADYHSAYPADIGLKIFGDKSDPLSGLTSDITLGLSIIDDPDVKNRMRKLLETFRPDIIQIDQLYPYFGLKQLLREMKINPILIYSANNVESKIKSQVFRDAGVSDSSTVKCVSQIEEVEKEATRDASFVIAVSEADAEHFRSLGARRVITAPNGIEPLLSSNSALRYWDKHFAKKGIRQFAVMVGSAHPPNWTGFHDMIGDALGFMPLGTQIVIAGGMSGLIKQHEFKPAFLAPAFWQRAEAVGRLDESSLAAILQLAKVVILPITSGGGSNLKTAEAILSGKHVVATPFAFRGFERFQALPGITLCSEPHVFRTTLVASLTAPDANRSLREQALARQVSWDHCLAGLKLEAAKL